MSNQMSNQIKMLKKNMQKKYFHQAQITGI